MRTLVLRPNAVHKGTNSLFNAGSSLFTRRISSLVIAVVILACPAILNAATYYLDAASGNDSAAGSTSAPWKSFSKAQASVISGDTVIMRTGSYGAFSQTKMYSSIVTYKADSGANVSTGSIALGNGSGYLRFEGLKVGGTVNLYGGDHVQLVNCDVRYPGDRYAAPANLVDIRYTTYGLVEGCNISHGKTGIKIDNAHYPTVAGNVITDLAVDVMTATPSYNFTCEGNHAYNIHQDRVRLKDYYSAWPFVAASSSVTVKDAVYSDLVVTVPSGFTGVAAYVNFATPMSFANLNSFSITQTATASLGSNVVLRVSTAANGSTSGTYIEVPLTAMSVTPLKGMTNAKSAAIVVKSSMAAFTLTVTDWNGSNGAHQDFCVFSGSDIIIRNNVFHDGCNQGIFTSPANGTNILIENNLIYDMEGFNLTNLDVSGSVVIRNNTFLGYIRGSGYTDPLNKYHLNGTVLVIPLDSGSGIKIYNNIIGAELSSVGGYNDYNIVTRQTTPGAHTLVLSGTNPNGINFEKNFFDAVDFRRYHGKLMNYNLASGSAAINFGTTSGQAAKSLGSLDSESFVLDNGPVRDASHHSAGARELGVPSSPGSGGSTNTAPVFDSVSAQTVAPGTALTFDVSASDAQGDAITYSASSLPTGATFAGQTFTWTPTTSQAGSYNVVFTASDASLSSSQTVAITVGTGTVNQAPVLAPIASKTITADTLLTFAVSATDAEGDAITYTASGLPTGASFTGSTFSWMPTLSQVGSCNVVFTASDAALSSSQTVAITVTSVAPVNHAPVMSTIGNKTVTTGTLLSFAVNATDQDGDAITYSASGVPSGATFVGKTFSWTPTSTQAGTYSVTFTASDGTLKASQVVQIAVSAPANAPVFAAIANQTVTERSLLTFTVKATVTGGTAITYAVKNLPQYATFSGGTFTWRPTYAQQGTYYVTFTATANGITTSKTVTIVVKNLNRVPVMYAIGAKTVTAGTKLTFTAKANDPDRDTLKFTCTPLPSGATFVGTPYGTFTWTPKTTQRGTYKVTAVVSDGYTTDSEVVTITVN